MATRLCEVYSFICIDGMKLNPAKESKFDCLLQAYSYVLYYILITVYNVVYHVQFYEISLCG